MEDLRKVRDGSTGNIVNGYVLNAVSIKWIPLLMERELLTDTEGTELTTRYDIFETQVQKIQSQFWSGSWILADRLYDDVKKYNLLLTEWFRFAIRMKTSRYVTMESILSGGYRETETWAIEAGDQIQISQKIQVADLPEWHYKITFPGLQRACFLTVTLKKGMKNPIRVLSSESDTGTVLQYLKRWEIERIFKTGKQELELESIGTKSKYKIDHLIVLVQLSLGISAHIYNRLHEQLITEEYSGKIVKRKAKYLALEGYNVNNKKAVVDATAFVKNMKRYLARVSKTFNRNSIICFIGDYMKKVRKIYWNLEKVTQKPQLSAQLSLGF